ncbi:MAG: hypothetical protein HQL08_09055 [Nitrospirae bacterium]|nr:hypothetical protein [Nitrospirota bacterium]
MGDLIVNVLAKGKGLLRRALGSGQVTFKVMFSRFRQVLENHNRAIEIIADMGDKLGGDYLFDIAYIRSAYEGLYATLGSSIESFNVLTRDRYPQLKNVFGRIDRDIRLLVYDRAAEGPQAFGGEDQAIASLEFVLPYSSITLGMSHVAGGKNANLAELKNNVEIVTPEAFAITASAYDIYMRHNKISEMISALGGNDGPYKAALNEIRGAILSGAVPPDLARAIEGAMASLKTKCGDKCFIAVRSSAQAEDGASSFAGQFETVLNVPLESMRVQEAYKQVLAGLFSDSASVYLKEVGIDIRNIKMAAACVLMVDAKVSGVIYSTNPGRDDGTLIINATWGLGAAIVEGRADSDFYIVRKGPAPAIFSKRTGKKDSMIVNSDEGGVATVKTPVSIAEINSLTDEQVLELARQAVLIENYFRHPQDIEWAIDEGGRIFILQARPLRSEALKIESQVSGARVLMKVRGNVVQRGVGAGRVFVFKHPDGLDEFSRGDILVARNDSSEFIRIMPYASAIITDTGSITSHMASLCREFRVPAFVNAGNATQVLEHGSEITVVADDEDQATVYDGILRDVVEQARRSLAAMEDVYEYRKKRYVLRYISPLNLVDPLLEKFSPEGCKTMHDILRFIHEKSVMELIDNAMRGLKGQAAKKLDLPIPAGIIVVDIGGGVLNSVEPPGGRVALGQVASIPLRAVLQGMTYPGAWDSAPVSLKVNDFMTSMMRMPDIASGSEGDAWRNVAVVSREYLNLSLRFGYHFNMIDCYCSETARNNHVYFRFTGGATDMVKRSRRIELISIVLKNYGFNTKSKGDLIIGRLANMKKEDMEKILDSLGRLIAYTRQLDAVLHDDGKVLLYANNFLAGDYKL